MNKTVIIPEWDQKYETGINSIDSQHKYFLDLIRLFYERVQNELNSTYIVEHMDELKYYAKFHFCCEENLMLRYNYKGYRAHRELHETLLKNLTQTISKYELGQINLNDFVNFLLTWFIKHTLVEDMKYSAYRNDLNLLVE